MMYRHSLLDRRLGRRGFLAASALGIAGALAACSGDGKTPAGEQGDDDSPPGVPRPEGWTDATHGNKAEPDYAVVFPQDRVNELKITIAPSDWQAMQENMVALYGQPGSGGLGRGGPAGVPGGPPPQAAPGQGAAGGPGGAFASENPMWVPATLEFGGRRWTKVGVRFKGNSSLRSSWSSGSKKLPLKLDFDEFEDDFPEVKNQRFFGFKQLSLANGFGDASYMRDKLTSYILDAAGHPASRTAHYAIVLDHGEGPVDLGVYVVIEVIDDTVVKRHFGSAKGNIYEGDGPGASLAQGTLGQLERSFLKENNTSSDWRDIRALYDVLHSPQRLSDARAWRSSLERVFDVDVFLEWLAISAILLHWDTYGGMTHNFYLYNNPSSSRLSWISWDHNLVLGGLGNPGAGGASPGGGGGGPNRNVSFDKREVGANWPLIRFLLDQDVYYQRYLGFVEKAVSGVFDPDRLAAKYREWAAFVGRAAGRGPNPGNFDAAVASLTNVTRERAAATRQFLAAAR